VAKRNDEIWAKWRALLRQQACSGESAAAFRRERGIGVTHFFEWRRKLSEAEAARFVEVRVAPLHIRALEVRLAGGRSVMVEAGFDAARLRAVLAVLDQATAPNRATSLISYESLRRPASTTSPQGAVTTYAYNDSSTAPSVRATTNEKWAKSSLDGLGRLWKDFEPQPGRRDDAVADVRL
jgi:YD repeat-containing protein